MVLIGVAQPRLAISVVAMMAPMRSASLRTVWPASDQMAPRPTRTTGFLLSAIIPAAFSMARLTHRDDREVAGAVLFALVLGGVLAGEALAPALLARMPAWTRLAARWGRAAPPRRIEAAVEAAVRQQGGLGETSGALLGAGGSLAPGTVPPRVLRAVEEIARLSVA